MNYVCKDSIPTQGRSLLEVANSKSAYLATVFIGLFNSYTKT
jgi:hypothetical protein